VARTPAIAAAERAGVTFRLHEYTHDPKASSYGLEAVDRLGLDAARVFKTLVVDRDGALEVAVVPVGSELDLKRLGGKRTALAGRAAAERVTGYVLGGISPLGQRKQLATTIDASALEHETVFVSAGRRGLEIELDPRDLARLTRAEVRRIARS
jgi:Cys-tRNA(Pro)/Cys-tRNA(Cys) deacylase